MGAAANRLEMFSAWLMRPVDIDSLVFFRIAFGGVLFLYLVFMLGSGLIGPLFIEPEFHFTYAGFSWVRPWPGSGMYVHYLVTAAAALGIALGCFYRLSTLLFLFGWTYIFLLEKAYYLNHFYLVSLIAFLLLFIPANAAFSVDRRRTAAASKNRKTGNRDASAVATPAYALYILRAQFAVVYFFAGISKFHPDWLRGQPMLGLVHNKLEFLEGVPELWLAYGLAYGGLLLDLLIVPALLWRRTRHAAVAAALLFHLSNSWLFKIDFFPVLAMAGTLMFYPPDWPRRVLAKVGRSGGESVEGGTLAAPVLPQKAIALILCLHFLVQLALPFRSYLYPGDHAWTERGHRFAWHLMQRTKRGRAAFIVEDQATGTRWRVDPEHHLTPRQVQVMSYDPEMLVQFARHLEGLYAVRGYPQVAVYAFARASLNNRDYQQLVDPLRDLTGDLWDGDWIVPLTTPLPAADHEHE